MIRRRRYRFRHTFSESERQELRDAQGGVCAACGRPPVTVVDHDHFTGRIRGGLCGSCNSRLGAYHDDPAALRARGHEYLAVYLGA